MNDSISASSNNHKTIILLGDKETGKTNLLLRYVKKKYYDMYVETPGIDYFCKEFNSQKDSINSNGAKILKNSTIYINLWDTFGAECDKKLLPLNVYKNANSFIICGSYDNLSSLLNIKNWLIYVSKYINGNGNGNGNNQVPIYIIFNKWDIPPKLRKFGVDEIKAQLKEAINNSQGNIKIFHQVSSKENINVDLVFDRILRVLTVVNDNINSRTIGTSFDNLDKRKNTNTELNFGALTNNKKSFSLRKERTSSKEDIKKDKSCC